jgi:hypothetical protein
MTKRNPKQEGTNLFDCVPQCGTCPMGCNQCFFNRPGAFYTEVPSIPTLEEVGDGIVRMNCGNDSNNQRDLVIKTAEQYPKVFFNTSIAKFDFPGPVVLTANPSEEDWNKYHLPLHHRDEWFPPAGNLMFVRLRTSSTNIDLVKRAADMWCAAGVPVVLTFMSYYDHEPEVPSWVRAAVGKCYEWKVRHINSYHCPTKGFVRWVMDQFHNPLVSMCGSYDIGYCKACLNCETRYIQTAKRLRGE